MLRIVSAAALMLTATIATAATHPYSIDDQVRFDRVSSPQLAPDGGSLVYQLRETDFEADKGLNSLWTLALAGGKATPQRITPASLGAHDAQWAPDGSALYFLAAKDGVQQLWRVAPGEDAEALSELPVDIGSFLIAPDGKQLALLIDVFPDCTDLACTAARIKSADEDPVSGVMYQRIFVRHWDTWDDGRNTQLFSATLKDDGLGEPVALSTTLDADITEPTFSPDSKTLAFSARLKQGEPWSTNFDIYTVAVDGSAAPSNRTAMNKAWDAGPLYSPDGKTLYYRAMKRPGFEADRYGIVALDLGKGFTREIGATWDRSAGALQVSPDGKTLYTTADDLGQHRLFAVDIASQRISALSKEGSVGDFDVGTGQIVLTMDDLDSPAQVYRISGSGKPKAITELNAERLADIEFGDYEQFSFKGWNDDEVHGYVVMPAGYKKGQKYPVAFIIHGGPQGSMGNHFHYRWNPQTYAGAGFAVVFIDFHGSTGYGQAFTDAISRDWGGKPLADLQKGWAYALEEYPFLDGDKACALGASYGGYMINWIAGQWPDAFQCLVNHDGVFDARSMYYSTEELWFPEWENGGPYYEKPDAYERFNPATRVERWKTPMMVIQGGLDYRVPLEQGLSAFTALQRQNIPSQFLYYPDENHWVLKPHNSVQWHREVEAWIKRWTGE